MTPLAAVREQLRLGTPLRDFPRRTGLSSDVLNAALDHLRYTGELTTTPLAGCPAQGCGGCASARACALRGPVALRLQLVHG
ncbi:MAG: hypothetical protein LBR58_02295 [Propionibacteriaceae bacterium]|jgi:hypothetical protein|nr:hypothetical protein [Propionibacteriaceae bacterium]